MNMKLENLRLESQIFGQQTALFTFRSRRTLFKMNRSVSCIRWKRTLLNNLKATQLSEMRVLNSINGTQTFIPSWLLHRRHHQCQKEVHHPPGRVYSSLFFNINTWQKKFSEISSSVRTWGIFPQTSMCSHRHGLVEYWTRESTLFKRKLVRWGSCREFIG